MPLMPVIGALPLSLDNCDGTALQRHRHDVSPKVTDGVLGVYLFQGRIDAQCLGQPVGIACRPRRSVSCLILLRLTYICVFGFAEIHLCLLYPTRDDMSAMLKAAFAAMLGHRPP